MSTRTGLAPVNPLFPDRRQILRAGDRVKGREATAPAAANAALEAATGEQHNPAAGNKPP
jgi:hypothetical protein